ncbi:universal stress protein [Actinacidiphila bryophytorum]|uniref:Nucleotide-binding universal stress protein, UspA family n=1 Tax=Actinacidiphila bryophytorum TaxID=1436133 RepID=A0A9W4H3B9_9ACTN|nr:universal stress protein [Actinacidiphila bryophytorum]MBM9438088.1 universal stress protein [Actinacidiphila bryophytorum]MBN6544545.1 universal stress protein [Actinacidiphila bryophytorum]CAG7647298.1 Nucleotide-binding universal stress protein, UspA family [Actinacidiphila bryophytorum]
MDVDRAAAPRGGGRTVVVGLDDSDSSWRAAAYAVGLARRQDALLVMVHVLPVHPTAMLAGLSWMLAADDLAVARQLRHRVAVGLAGTLGHPAPRWEFHILRAADVVAGLAETADAMRADTVVIGASRGLRHRLFGSPGVRLVKTGRWPVIVVP